MYGAIIGDMVGAPYEFDKSEKTKAFELFNRKVHFTDDSVMTVAVAEALLKSEGKSDEEVKKELVLSMQKWGRRYPNAGYGGMFYIWMKDRDPKPYWSFGNGSAMRVSAAGRLYDTLEDTRRYARLSAEVTHNHPEGIKGAEAVACVIFLARKGASKDEIRDFVTREFGYDLSRGCDEIRPWYHFDVTCQGTVPEAITAFLEGESFEDVIRTAVSLGGDCDTLTCIAGGMAEAYYGIPEEMLSECRKRLPKDMLEILDHFYGTLRKEEENVLNTFLEGNEVIEKAIENYYTDSNCNVEQHNRPREAAQLLSSQDESSEQIKSLLRLLGTKLSKEVTETILQIMNAIAKHYHISIGDMISKKRSPMLSTVRAVAMYTLRQHTDLSLSMIGAIFDRDINLVIDLIERGEKEYADNTVLNEKIHRL